MKITIKKVTPDVRHWVLEIVRGWGADFVVTCGRKVFPADIDGFYAVTDNGEKVGLATYEIVDDQCEVVTLDALRKFPGIGTALIEKVALAARDAGCRRLWLVTTNDNLDAIRFYQRRGFTLAAVHVNALTYSRTLKPSIPVIGQYGIELRHELEFEMPLQTAIQ